MSRQRRARSGSRSSIRSAVANAGVATMTARASNGGPGPRAHGEGSAALDARDRRSHSEVRRADHADQRADHLAQAAGQRLERCRSFGVRVRGCGCVRNARIRLPCARSASAKRGNRAQQRQAIDVAGMDAGQQRLGQVVGRFAAEAARMKPPIDSSPVVGAPGDEHFGAHAQLPGPREEAGAKKRTDPRRNAEHRRRWQAHAAGRRAECRRGAAVSSRPGDRPGRAPRRARCLPASESGASRDRRRS